MKVYGNPSRESRADACRQTDAYGESNRRFSLLCERVSNRNKNTRQYDIELWSLLYHKPISNSGCPTWT